MKKKVLTEKAIYFGKPSMPKGYEIDNESLFVDIAGSNAYDIKFPYSKPWQLLTTYVTEHINLHFGISICNAETWGEVIYPNKKCKILKAPTSYANHFVLLVLICLLGDIMIILLVGVIKHIFGNLLILHVLYFSI